MPDIREPYPINPIWPTKPGKQPDQRKRPASPAEQERARRKDREKEKPDDSPPHIDDYA